VLRGRTRQKTPRGVGHQRLRVKPETLRFLPQRRVHTGKAVVCLIGVLLRRRRPRSGRRRLSIAIYSAGVHVPSARICRTRVRYAAFLGLLNRDRWQTPANERARQDE